MRVFYWPQLSMRSYVDNRWLFQSDAQVTKMRHYHENLPEWEWLWAVPQGSLDVNWAEGLPDGVAPHAFSWMDNVLEGRYYFPMREVMDLLSTYVPDVMLLEVPELVRPMRVVQQYTGKKFPIIAMVEHVDIYEHTRVHEHVRYMLRQIDGALAADVMAFPLEGMKEEWIKAASDTVSNMVNEELANLDDQGRLPVWNAIYSPQEVERSLDAPVVANEKQVIFFISRLSDNQRTRYEEFFEAVRLIEDGSFEVWVANPNEAMDPQDVLGLCDSVTRVGTSGRAEYIDLLWHADIVPILYPQTHIYSLGFCEAITAQNLVTTTFYEGNDEGMAEVFNGIVEPVVNANTIAEQLDVLLEMETERKLKTLKAQQEWLFDNRSVEMNIDKVLQTIMGVMTRV